VEAVNVETFKEETKASGKIFPPPAIGDKSKATPPRRDYHADGARSAAIAPSRSD
jgi:hypothetical protein